MSSISSPLYFNGLSTYSSDLNNVISRTVQIASVAHPSIEQRRNYLNQSV